MLDHDPRRALVRGLRKTLMAAIAVLLAGCGGVPLSDQVIGPSYQPGNFQSRSAALPRELRRVAVLPLTAAKDDPQLEAGREALEAVVWAELIKTKRFEVVRVSTDQLALWTGRAVWRAEERLPDGFLGRVKEETSADAVLFCQLTDYRGYPPLAVGWNMKLVDAGPSPILWSVDEYFDAGNPQVVNAARRYCQQESRDTRNLSDSFLILGSPRRFGQYTASAVLATLPGR